MRTKLLFFVSLLLATLFNVGCNPSAPDTPPKDVTYTITADKTEVALNEEVTFSVISSEGKDVTADWQFCDDAVCFGPSRVIKWSTPGSYLVKAQLGADPQVLTDNKLTILVKGSVFELSANKVTVFERESVTFKITEIKDGVEQTVEPTNFRFGIKNGERFSSKEQVFPNEGVYTIDAIKVNGITGVEIARSHNTLEIIVKKKKPVGYEDNFYRRSFLAEYTATWCVNCPDMVTVLDYAQDHLAPDRFVTAAFHWLPSEGGLKDECNVEYVAPVIYMTKDYNLNEFPSYVVDWNAAYVNPPGTNVAATIKYATTLSHFVDVSQARYGGELTPGIAMETSLSGRNLSIKVKVTPRETANYYLGLLFVEDGMETYQNGGSINCPTHPGGCMIQNNVVHKTITQGNNTYNVDVLGSLTADKESVFDYNLNDIAARYNLTKCRVIAYVCKADTSIVPLGYFCANATTVKVGSNLDYEYEPIYDVE